MYIFNHSSDRANSYWYAQNLMAANEIDFQGAEIGDVMKCQKGEGLLSFSCAMIQVKTCRL